MIVVYIALGIVLAWLLITVILPVTLALTIATYEAISEKTYDWVGLELWELVVVLICLAVIWLLVYISIS